MKYAAFFDLDYTIINTNSMKHLIQFMYKRGLISFSQYFFGMVVSFIYKFDRNSGDRIIRKWVCKFKGISASEMDKLIKTFFENVVKNRIKIEAREAVYIHQEKGAETYILSSSARAICEPVQKELRMNGTICTEFEVKNDMLTGNIVNNFCSGEEKRRQIEEYCRDNEVSIKDVYYYGDSYPDRFALEAVGHPICVSPDRKLKKLAKHRGWEIRYW